MLNITGDGLLKNQRPIYVCGAVGLPLKPNKPARDYQLFKFSRYRFKTFPYTLLNAVLRKMALSDKFRVLQECEQVRIMKHNLTNHIHGNHLFDPGRQQATGPSGSR